MQGLCTSGLCLCKGPGGPIGPTSFHCSSTSTTFSLRIPIIFIGSCSVVGFPWGFSYYIKVIEIVCTLGAMSWPKYTNETVVLPPCWMELVLEARYSCYTEIQYEEPGT